MFQRTFNLLGAVGALLLPTVFAECTSEALVAFADTYVSAQESGDPGALENLAGDFVYIQDNKTAEIADGILSTALVIDHRRTFVDPIDCATFTEIVVTGDDSPAGDAPYVIGTQIRHNPEDMTSYLIDSIVSTTGHWLFNATGTLYWINRETWDPIPEDARDTRELLKNAADAYLSMWDNATAADAVPWGTPCARLEGSVYTGNGGPNDSCKLGIPSNHNQAPNSGRRYVIDEAMGTISVLCVFEHLSMAPDSHLFRLENGKVRYIHTITLASSGGFTPPPPPSPWADVPKMRGTTPLVA